MQPSEALTIKRLSNDGSGVTHFKSGKTVFVETGVPGDVVLVSLKEDRDSFARAHITQLLEPSTLRVKPPCPWFFSCGGCSWQHINYQTQLDTKRNIIVDSLVRIAHIEAAKAEILVANTLGSKHEYHYRNKLELGAKFTSQNGFNLGLTAQGSHELVNIDACMLAHKHIADAPKALRGALRFLCGNNTSNNRDDLDIYRVGIRHSNRTKSLEIALWCDGKHKAFPRTQAVKVINSALGSKCSSIVRVVAQKNTTETKRPRKVEVLYVDGFWREELAGVSFFTSAPSFFQVNSSQATALIDLVVKQVENNITNMVSTIGAKNKAITIADLYAGGGTFAIPVAKAMSRAAAAIQPDNRPQPDKSPNKNLTTNDCDNLSQQESSLRHLRTSKGLAASDCSNCNILAIESVGSSVRDLRRNAEINAVANTINIIGGDVVRELQHLTHVNHVIVDPPRSGLAPELINAIAMANIANVGYVSCNPATLARDIARFSALNYELQCVQPIDLFPQTPHIECIGLLSKKK